jgi:hypothetical protein
MSRFLFLISILAVWLSAASTDADDQPSTNQPAVVPNPAVRTFVENHCITCHAGAAAEAGLSLEDVTKYWPINDHRDIWLNVVRKVEGEEMPPESESQPDTTDRARFLGELELELSKYDCAAHVQPGRVTIRRLNRTEYNLTIRDLIGVDFDPAEEFPADDVGAGFDNLADILSLPPLLMEKYLDAAAEIMRRAMADDSIRRRLLPVIPTSDAEFATAARGILTQFVRRAFRRPPRDGEVDRLCELFELANRSLHDFEQSMQFAMQAVLVSPHFLFRVELEDDDDASRARRLTSHEIATRLSYFLWSTMPDEELFRLADENRLQDDEVLAHQVVRMLQDPKSEALVVNFAGQWLELRNLGKLTPATEIYPAFDEDLRTAMQKETELLVRSIIDENRSVLDFIDCDYTFLNERLARHYGIDGVRGDVFQRVSLPDRRRGGLLGQASIMTLTSNPTRTSPVKRGKWILDNILGDPPPPPPPNVKLLVEGDVELLGSLRDRMVQHRDDASCAVCHKKMDALGLGFENYDGIGAWRDTDGRFDIDASGELPGRKSFTGPIELKQFIKTYKQKAFMRCLAEKMMIYALGRELGHDDRCTIDIVVSRLAQEQNRFVSLVQAIVASDAFRLRGELKSPNGID